MTATGLLVGGKLVQVPGVLVHAPASAGGPAWSSLSTGDYRSRKERWVRQGGIHTTKGMWPQQIEEAPGPAGRVEHVARFFHKDPRHAGAHIGVGSDGVAACYADLARQCVYHATVANEVSFGLEIYQEAGGIIHRPALTATVAIMGAAFDALGIPRQYAADPYAGRPISRLASGGEDFVGAFGHRSNTSSRGRGDPGEEIFAMLQAAGWEPVMVGSREDLAIGRHRQEYLRNRGAKIAVDGLVGPASMRAARELGFALWSDVPQGTLPATDSDI